MRAVVAVADSSLVGIHFAVLLRIKILAARKERARLAQHVSSYFVEPESFSANITTDVL